MPPKRTQKRKPRPTPPVATVPAPPDASPPTVKGPPARNWRRIVGRAALGTAAAVGAALLARYGLRARQTALDGRVDGTIDATPVAMQYDDPADVADVIVDVDPGEAAYVASIPTEPMERNAWALGLLGDVMDRFDDRSPQHMLARYFQQYILGGTHDGAPFDTLRVTSARTGETVPLYAAVAPLLEMAEPRLVMPHDRARMSGDLYDVQYEF